MFGCAKNAEGYGPNGTSGSLSKNRVPRYEKGGRPAAASSSFPSSVPCRASPRGPGKGRPDPEPNHRLGACLTAVAPRGKMFRKTFRTVVSFYGEHGSSGNVEVVPRHAGRSRGQPAPRENRTGIRGGADARETAESARKGVVAVIPVNRRIGRCRRTRNTSSRPPGSFSG